MDEAGKVVIGPGKGDLLEATARHPEAAASSASPSRAFIKQRYTAKEPWILSIVDETKRAASRRRTPLR
jgi:hypothetical protein